MTTFLRIGSRAPDLRQRNDFGRFRSQGPSAGIHRIPSASGHFATNPVTSLVKSKEKYSRARWQLDAHALWRSNGNRLIAPEEFVGIPADEVYKKWRAHSETEVYDFEHHVAVGEAREAKNQLPPGFMLLPPASWHPDVWSDVTRMRTLNGAQYAAGKELHVCPLQFDIVDRLIARFSNPGDVVYDPFGGLGTVAIRAVEAGRRGYTVELSTAYWADSVWYLKRADERRAVPTLFDSVDLVEAAS